MKTQLRLITGLLAVFFSYTVSAQGDVHYSQFYTAPTYINPATSGAFLGDLRFFSNFRSQWTSVTPKAYRTITGSIDAPIHPKTGNNAFGAGLTFFNDKSGDGSLTTTNFTLNGSYLLEVASKSYFTFGVGLSYLQKSVDFTQFYWHNQWNGETFDPFILSGENGFADKFQTLDLSAGIYYFSYYNNDLKYFGGTSVGHINRPNVSFLGDEEKLMMKFTIHGGFEWHIPNTNMNLLPNTLIVLQGPNRIYNIGTDVKYLIRKKSERLVFNDEISVNIGAYYRIQDAAYATVRFNYAGLSFGAAYDLTLSDLSAVNNGMGAMEFFVKYIALFGKGGGVSMFRG